MSGSPVASIAVNLPTYAAGDTVLIAIDGFYTFTTETASAAGWTQDARIASSTRIVFAFRRVMAGNEGSTVTFSFSSGAEHPWAIAATYTGASSIEASIVTNQQNAVNSWSMGPVTTTGPDRTVVALVSSTTPNAGTDFTTVNGAAVKRADVVSAGDPDGSARALMIADLSAVAAGNYSMSGSISSFTLWQGVLLALIPR